MANLENLDFKNLNPEKLQQFLKEQNVTKEDMVDTLKSNGVSEEEIKRLLELSQHGGSTEVVVEEAKGEVSNILSRRNVIVGSLLIALVILLLWGISGGNTKSTQEGTPNNMEEEGKPDAKWGEAAKKTYTVKAENTTEATTVENDSTAENNTTVENDSTPGNVSIATNNEKSAEGEKEKNNEEANFFDELGLEAKDLEVVQHSVKKTQEAEKKTEELKFAYGHKKDK